MDALILIRTVVFSQEQFGGVPHRPVTLAPKVERVDWRLNGTPSDGAIGEVAVSADTSASATP